MPRTTGTLIACAFGQIQKRAQQLLANLRSEIRSNEADLKRLREEQSKPYSLIGLRAIERARAAPVWRALVQLESIGDASWNRCRSNLRRATFATPAKSGASAPARSSRRSRDRGRRRQTQGARTSAHQVRVLQDIVATWPDSCHRLTDLPTLNKQQLHSGLQIGSHTVLGMQMTLCTRFGSQTPRCHMAGGSDHHILRNTSPLPPVMRSSREPTIPKGAPAWLPATAPNLEPGCPEYLRTFAVVDWPYCPSNLYKQQRDANVR